MKAAFPHPAIWSFRTSSFAWITLAATPQGFRVRRQKPFRRTAAIGWHPVRGCRDLGRASVGHGGISVLEIALPFFPEERGPGTVYSLPPRRLYDSGQCRPGASPAPTPEERPRNAPLHLEKN